MRVMAWEPWVPPADKEDSLASSALIGFIDETRQLLRKRNAEEPRGLEIDGDLESLDRHGVERQQPFPVENALREQSGFPADIAVVDGHAEQRSQACELR